MRMYDQLLDDPFQTQRNLCTDRQNARDRYIARYSYAQLLDKYTINNNGPFKLLCDDLGLQNMLADLETLKITAVLDLEFTNAMPSQYASEPPWWLLLAGLDSYLYRGCSMLEFVTKYEPRLEQFLQAMERAENARGIQGEERLSTLMRESWDSNRFSFNFEGRKMLDVDVHFQERLNKEGTGLEYFLEMKMEQVKAYDEDCRAKAD